MSDAYGNFPARAAEGRLHCLVATQSTKPLRSSTLFGCNFADATGGPSLEGIVSSGFREELVVIRTVALLLALAVVQPALAQTAPTPAPNPSPTKPSPAKPAAKKPAPAKSDAGATPAAAAA